MKNLMIRAAAAFCFALLCVSGVAHAAAEVLTAYPIDVQEPLSYLVSLIVAAISGVIGFALALLKKKTGISLSTEHQAYLDNAVASALLYAHDKAQQHIANLNDPTVKNKIIADAANVVLESVPTLLKKLGITPEKLRQLVEDRLNATGALNGSAQSSQ